YFDTLAFQSGVLWKRLQSMGMGSSFGYQYRHSKTDISSVANQVLCIIPVPILRWALCGVAFGLSGYFLVSNVYPILATTAVGVSDVVSHPPQNRSFILTDIYITGDFLQAEARATRLLVIVLVLLHAGLAFAFKLQFFSYYVVEPIGGADPIGGMEPVDTELYHRKSTIAFSGGYHAPPLSVPPTLPLCLSPSYRKAQRIYMATFAAFFEPPTFSRFSYSILWDMPPKEKSTKQETVVPLTSLGETDGHLVEVEAVTFTKPRAQQATAGGRGGTGNVFHHVIEPGVFQRVIEHETARIVAHKAEQQADKVLKQEEIKLSKSATPYDDLSSSSRPSTRLRSASTSTFATSVSGSSSSTPSSASYHRHT
ncbi:12888_t:CDS:2, partial [Acaulospora colombiana]